MILLEVLALICCFYLLFPLFSSLMAAIFNKKILSLGKNTPDFACIITVYKEMEIALPLIRALEAQNYPNFHIYLLADQIGDKPGLASTERLTFLKPEKDLNSKVASIDYVLKRMESKHTHVVVFDPDNLVPTHFLSSLDRYHAEGFPAVQGKRIAKNMDTTYAALDALGEYFYDYTVRHVPFTLRSSSVIAGSGMSIRRDLYQLSIEKEMKELQKSGVVVAEDKALQLLLVNMGHRIAYAPDAIIFDEKVASFHQVSRQRSRWLNSYFKHSQDALKTLFQGIVKLDWNRIWFAITTLMPPLFILVLTSLFLFVVFFFIKPPVAILIGLSLIGFGFGFVMALVLNKAPARVFKAIPHIPLFVLGQLSGLFKIRRANKDFMATSHNQIVEIEEVWRNRKAEFRHLSHLWENNSRDQRS